MPSRKKDSRSTDSDDEEDDDSRECETESSTNDQDDQLEHNDDGEDDEDEEFVIESVLAKRNQNGKTQYLIRWEGWDLLCATWEPEEMFNNKDETLKSWRENKLQILAGRKPDFNVNKFNKDKARIAAEVLERTGSTLEEYNDQLQTKMEEYLIHKAQQVSDSDKISHETPKQSTSAVQSAIINSQSTTPMQSPLSGSSVLPKIPKAPEVNPKGSNPPQQSQKQKPQPSNLTQQSMQPPHSKAKTPIVRPPRSNFATGGIVKRGPHTNSDRAPLPHQVSLQRPSEVGGRLPGSLAIPWDPEVGSAPLDSVRSVDESSPAAQVSTDRFDTQKAVLVPQSSASEAFPGQLPASERSTPNLPEIEHPDSVTKSPLIPTSSHSEPLLGDPLPSENWRHLPPTPFISEPSPAPETILPALLATEILPSRLKRLKNSVKKPEVSHLDRRPGSPLFVSQTPDKRRRIASPRRTDAHRPTQSSKDELLDRYGESDKSLDRQSSHDHDHPDSSLSLPSVPRTSDAEGGRPSDPSPTVSANRTAPLRTSTNNAPSVSVQRSNDTLSSEWVEARAADIQLKPPMPRAKFLDPNHFANPGELLVRVFFGPNKSWIGFARLCGASSQSLRRLQSKRDEEPLEMWFRHICTRNEYDNLCKNVRKNVFYDNAWTEGFEDSNRDLLQMEETLYRDECVALFTSATAPENTWLAYSRSCAEVYQSFTRDGIRIPSSAVLVLAVRSGLMPGIVHTIKDRTGERRQVPEKVSPLMPTSRYTSNSEDTGLDLEKSKAPTDPRHRLSQSGVVSDDPPRSINEQGLNHASKMDKELCSRVSQIISKIKQLSTFALGNGTSNPVEFFFLHFPADEKARQEMKLVEFLLRDMRIFSNREPEGWAIFINSCRNGAIIFHESFQDYGSLKPPIRDMSDAFHFWLINLTTPLELPGTVNRETAPDIQKLFPTGGAVLFTEETFYENLEKATRVILWFYFKCTKRSSSRWKLFLWPEAVKKMEIILENPHRNKDNDRYLELILSHIRKMNSPTDPSCDFQEESSDILQMDRPGYNVVCLPVANYGQQYAHIHNAVPSGLSQAELNADHLVEAFAGWMQQQAMRFRQSLVIANIDNKRLMKRWDAWGHLSILNIQSYYKKFELKHHFYDDYLYASNKAQQDGQPDYGRNGTADSPVYQPKNPGGISLAPRAPLGPKAAPEPSKPLGSVRDPRLAYRKSHAREGPPGHQ